MEPCNTAMPSGHDSGRTGTALPLTTRAAQSSTGGMAADTARAGWPLGVAAVGDPNVSQIHGRSIDLGGRRGCGPSQAQRARHLAQTPIESRPSVILFA